MSEQRDKAFVQHSIDTGLESMQGNPFLAQRIMNQERTEQPVMKKKISFAFILAMILLIVSIATAVAGAVNEDFNAWLYRIWPEAAVTLMPVNLSCEDNGIRMEVISAVADDTEVYVTFSMQDLEGDRIHENTEAVMFADSGLVYSWSADPAEPLYMKDEKTIVYGQKMLFDGGTLTNHKLLTASVDRLDRYNMHTVDLLPLYRQYSGNAKTMQVPDNAHIFGGYISDTSVLLGLYSNEEYQSLPKHNLYSIGLTGYYTQPVPDTMQVLDTESGPEVPLTDDVTLSGIGMVDGLLHVQIHYKNYWSTDSVEKGLPDSVDVYMYDADDDGSYSTMDKYNIQEKLINGISHLSWERKNKNGKRERWEELMFTVDSEPTEAQKLLADVTVQENPIPGNWQVDIPLRLIRNAK